MSNSIETRVVQMQFENSQFEKGVSQTLKSLEGLKKATDFKDLQRAGDSFSLAKMAQGIDSITQKFTLLGQIGMRVIQGLADKVVGLGESFIKSVSVDQISAGFNKYADKTKAVQTIVNATGKDIAFVDEQLSKLAWFTDETSYNFVDMVSNIGKFTSMNIPLDTSVTAMQGIATWAAVSGQGINEASRAMYNLSQAVGAGYVKLIDWKSIQNANMATAEFKQTAIDTARELGTLSAAGMEGKVSIENFDQTLQKGWFTKDVLIKTLQKYGEYADEVFRIVQEEGIPAAQAMERVNAENMELGEKAFKAAQEAKTFVEAIEAVKDAVSTGWMNTFENIFGNYEEAKVLWTDLANDLWDIFASGAEARNDLLAAWKEFGGRDDLIAGLTDAMQALKGIIEAVKEGFRTIFPETTVHQLKEISYTIKQIGEKLKETFAPRLIGYKGTFTKVLTQLNPLGTLKENLEKGMKGTAVKALQKRLQSLGYDLGNAGADGIFGPKTQEALNKFKEEYGLTIDGVYDQLAHNKLGEALGLEGRWVETTQEGVEEIYKIPPAFTMVANIASGLFSILGIGVKIFKFLANAGLKILGVFSPVANVFVVLTDAAARFLTALNLALDEINFDEILANLEEYLVPVKESINALCQSFLSLLGLGEDLNTIDFGEFAQKAIGKVKEFLGSIKNFFKTFKNGIKSSGIAERLSGAFNRLGISLKAIKYPLKNMWTNFKKSLGEKFTSVTGSIPEKLANITASIGDFIANGIDKLVPWILKIPQGVRKIKDFFKSLTDKGNPAIGKKPGFLIRVKDAFKSVIDFLFGKSDPTKGKQNGIFRKLWMLITGDLDGLTEGMNEDDKKKTLDRINGIKDFIGKIGEALTLLLFGPVIVGSKLTEGTKTKIENLRKSIGKIVSAARGLFTGDFGENTELSEETQKKITEIRNKIANILKVIKYLFTGDDGSTDEDTEGLSEETKAKIDGFKKFISGIVESVKGLFTGEFIKDSTVSENIQKFITSVHDKIREIVQAIKYLFTGDDGSTDEDTEGLSEETKAKIDGFKKFISGIVESVKGLFTGEFIKDSTVPENVQNIITSIREKIVGLIQSIRYLFTGNDGSTDEDTEGLSEETKAKIDGFKKFFTSIFESVKGLFTGEFIEDSSVSESLQNIITSIREKIVSLIKSIRYLFTGDDGSTDEDTEGLSEETKAKIDGFKKFISGIVESVKGLFTGEFIEDSTVSENVQNFITSVHDKIREIVQAIKYLFTGDDGSTDEDTEGLSEDTKAKVDNFKKFFASIFETVKGLFTGDFIKDSSVPTTLQNIIRGIHGRIKNIIRIVKYLFAGKDGVSDEDTEGLTAETVQKVDRFKQFFIDIFYAVKGLFTGDFLEGHELSDNLQNIITDIHTRLNKIIAEIKLLFTGTETENSDLDKGTVDNIKQIRKVIEDILNAIAYLFTGNEKYKVDLPDGIVTVIEQIRSWFDGIIKAVQGLFGGGDTDTSEVEGQIEEKKEGISGILESIFGSDGLTASVANIGGDRKPFSLGLGGKLAVGGGILAIGKVVTSIFSALDSIAWIKGGDKRSSAIPIIMQVADLLKSLAIAFGVVALSVIAFSSMKAEKLGTGVEAFKTIMHTIMWLIGELAGIGVVGMLGGGVTKALVGESITPNLKAIGDTLIGVGLAVGAITAAILFLPKDESVFEEGLRKVKLILDSLSKFLKDIALASILSGGVKFNIDLGSLSSFANAIAILSLTGYLLGKIKSEEEFEKGVERINKIAGTLQLLLAETGIFSVLNNLTSQGKGGTIKIQGFFGFAAAVAVLAYISNELSKVDDKQFDTGFERLEKIAGVLVGFPAVIEVIGAVAGILEKKGIMESLTKTGADAGGAIAACAGIAALGGAIIEIFFASIAKIPTLITGDDNKALQFFEDGGEILGKIAEGLGRFIGGLKAGYKAEQSEQLEEDITSMGETLSALATAFEGLELDTSDGNFDSKVTAAIDIMTKLKEFFETLSGYTLNTADFDAMNTYRSAVDPYLKDVESFGSTMNDLSDKLSVIKSTELTVNTRAAISAATSITTFLQSLSSLDIETSAKGIKGWFADNTKADTVFESIKKFGENIGEAGSAMNGFGAEGSTFTQDIEAGLTAVRAVIGLLQELNDPELTIQDPNSVYGGHQIDNFKGAMSYVSEMATELKRYQGITEGVDYSSLADFTTVIANLKTILSGDDSGSITSENFIKGLDATKVITKLTEFTAQVGESVQTNSETLSSYNNQFNSSGAGLVDAMASGMAGDSSASDAVGKVAANAASAGMAYQGKFRGLGLYFVTGMAIGVSSNSGILSSAMTKLVQDALAKAREAGEVESPSKKTMEIGKFLSLGMAIGITKYGKAVTKSSEEMTNDSVNTLSGMFDTIGSLSADDFNTQPIISPVVDTSNVRMASSYIDGMFGDRTFGLKSSILASSMASSTDSATKSPKFGSPDVVSAVNDMNDRIGALGEAIGGMQMVVDSGALVGQVASKMDQKLGVILARRGRLG